MKRILSALLLAGILSIPLHAEPAPAGGGPQGSESGQVRELQEKMLGDDLAMALILSLKDDPEMQALLNDPAVVSAVQAGDLGALTANPRFMKLLDNAKVREIQKRVGQ
jgi:hypothetical protein